MTTVINGMNILFAIAAAVTAFDSCRRMNGSTGHTIKIVFASIGVAMVGQTWILFHPESWQAAINTLAYGSLAALLIGSRRSVTLLPPPWPSRIALAVLGSTWVAFYFGIDR